MLWKFIFIVFRDKIKEIPKEMKEYRDDVERDVVEEEGKIWITIY